MCAGCCFCHTSVGTAGAAWQAADHSTAGWHHILPTAAPRTRAAAATTSRHGIGPQHTAPGIPARSPCNCLRLSTSCGCLHSNMATAGQTQQSLAASVRMAAIAVGPKGYPMQPPALLHPGALRLQLCCCQHTRFRPAARTRWWPACTPPSASPCP